MARKLLDLGLYNALTSSAGLGAGWKLNVYDAGTATRATTYNAPTAGSANANPVVADADGRFDEIWLTTGASYKYVLTDAADVVKVTVDNYAVDAAAGSIAAGLVTFIAGSAPLPVANGGTASTTAADAAVALAVLKLTGGTVSGNITRTSKGVHLYHDAAGCVNGGIFITASGAADPTSAAGQVWLKY